MNDALGEESTASLSGDLQITALEAMLETANKRLADRTKEVDELTLQIASLNGESREKFEELESKIDSLSFANEV